MLNKHKSEKSEAEEIKQIQKGGDGASQYQAGVINVYEGVTEKRVCEIVDERVHKIYNELAHKATEANTQEALDLAFARIEKLEEKVMEKAEKVSGFIPAFSDPYFQFLLKKSQQSAASTERENDYDVLAELLVCHVEKGEERINRAAISRAIEIVGDIDNEALCALTLVYAVTSTFPALETIKDGLSRYSDIIEKLFYLNPSPIGDWLDHLDVLGAVRMSPTPSTLKLQDMYVPHLIRCGCIGIKKGSKEYKKAKELLVSIGWNPNILIENELLPGYFRLDIPTKEYIKEMEVIQVLTDELRDINSKETGVFEQIWDMYSTDSKLQRKAIDEFMKRWDSFEPLKNLRLWWEQIPYYVELTKTGYILGYTNTKRCYDGEIPDLIL